MALDEEVDVWRRDEERLALRGGGVHGLDQRAEIDGIDGQPEQAVQIPRGLALLAIVEVFWRRARDRRGRLAETGSLERAQNRGLAN
ncbi:hypothetical protein JQ612_27615 [Bradyrhizobium manausense]|uniref:hypothetical protein n=1 Tax=Bradyrhizobium manausense TaxID=989370 RepID=UPI001BA7DD3C|nr:hypothetical protein [Bradyrhizobium manausense]MBR0836980.1 hypothetical protein [Bradyrhizobium manausense]